MSENDRTQAIADRNDREVRLLEQLDTMTNTEWAIIVTYMSEKLARENNKLLIETVVHRGLLHARKVHTSQFGPTDLEIGEAVALMAGCADLELMPR